MESRLVSVESGAFDMEMLEAGRVASDADPEFTPCRRENSFGSNAVEPLAVVTADGADLREVSCGASGGFGVVVLPERGRVPLTAALHEMLAGVAEDGLSPAMTHLLRIAVDGVRALDDGGALGSIFASAVFPLGVPSGFPSDALDGAGLDSSGLVPVLVDFPLEALEDSDGESSLFFFSTGGASFDSDSSAVTLRATSLP